MARRAVQAVCVHRLLSLKKKVPEHLAQQLKAMREAGEFTERLYQLAKSVKVFGDSGAHTGKDGLDTVSEDDAIRAAECLEHVLQHVFFEAEESETENGD